MKNVKSLVTIATLIIVLLGVNQSINAATNWKNFAKTVPEFQGWTDLSSAKKTNSSRAVASISSVGSDYKVNLAHWHNSTRVSGYSYDVGDKTERSFTIDSSAENYTIKLGGQFSRWSTASVDVIGKWTPDSN